MSDIKKLQANFGMKSKWQREVYEWALEQSGSNQSGWLVALLYHFYLESKKENPVKEV